LTVAQMILWVFGVDDEGDERLITLAEMRRKAEKWYLIAKNGPENDVDTSDELTAILLEMMDNLSRSSMFESLREYWASRLRILVEAMAQEYEYGLQYGAHGVRALPTLDEYIRGGIHSIGFPLWGTTVLILLRDPSVVNHLESIERAMEYAGAAGRLYNDIRTLDRELQESNINSIVVVYRALLNENPNMAEKEALSEATQHILRLADSYAQRCYDLLGQIHTDTGQIEETIFHVTNFNAYFYVDGRQDYHTASLATARECLTMAYPESLSGGDK
jgi:hypothetical protein